MKISLQWLREWVDAELEPKALGSALTMAGFELESIAPAAPPFAGVRVAEIVSAAQHPQADKLRVCEVSLGEGGALLQIVCGAPNARAGLKTALATVGAQLPGDLKIKAAKLRGVESAGMLCSAKELGLSEVSEGIIELPADASVGADLREYLALDDTVLELAVTPNRGDAMSMRGVARGSRRGRSSRCDSSRGDGSGATPCRCSGASRSVGPARSRATTSVACRPVRPMCSPVAASPMTGTVCRRCASGWRWRRWSCGNRSGSIGSSRGMIGGSA